MVGLSEARDLATKHSWLTQSPPEFRTAVLDRVALREFKSRNMVHLAGDESGGMYGLVAGSVKVLVQASDHGPYYTHIFRPGSWFGEAQAIIGKPRQVTLYAIDDVSLLFLPIAAIQHVAELNRYFWKLFLIPLTENLNLTLVALADLMIRDPATRLIAILLRLGGCRDSTPPSFSYVDVDASQEELAAMANIGRTKASDVLQRLQSDGLIEIAYGHIRIRSPGKLRRILEASA